MIWFLIDSSGTGGAERHIATLHESLQNIGVESEVVLYANYGANPWLEQLRAIGASFHHLDGTFSGLLSALRSARPSLLHTHGYKAGILGRLAARISGIPVISTFHSGEREPYPVSLYSFIDEWTSFLGSRIAVSEAVAARLPFKATHVANYIKTGERPSPVQSLLPRCVAFVGRLSEEKRPDFFCELARQGPPGIEWHVYGDGPMRVDLESRYGETVRFHGVVTDLAPVWPRIGLLVQPSRFEGLPLAPLEAMTAGVPVLASRVGGLPSIVIPGKTGWLFASGDIEGALACLKSWLEQSKDASDVMRFNCWQHVELNFSEARRLPDLIAAYRRAGFVPELQPSLTTLAG